MQFDERLFRMKVWDNGMGFDPTSAAQSGGVGLRGIEERVQRINGKVLVDSSPGNGTSIFVQIEV